MTTTVIFHEAGLIHTIIIDPPVFDRPSYSTLITEEDDRNLPKRVLKVQSVWSARPE